jgi:hypothetical protein
MKKIQVLLSGLILTASTLQAQTTFRLELIAEGNFGTPNADIFVRNTTVNPATNSAGMYQTANGVTNGYDVLQDYVIAGNKAILGEKPSGAGRITIVNYPAMTEIHTFAQSAQTLGVASETKAYACYPQGGTVALIDLQNNTLTPVIEPNNEISTYCNFMQYANGFMYLDQAGQLVKIDTLSNTVVSKFNPNVGSIKGLVYDQQGKLWVLGGSSLISVDVLNNDALSTVINMGVTAKLLRYYNNKLYFWENSAKSLYQYDIVTPPVLPLSPIYTSTLIGSAGSFGTFGYGRSFDIDPSTGDFVIASANNYSAPGYYEVVDGTTFNVIESGSIPGCAIPNKCVLKTFHPPVGSAPVPDQTSLSSVSAQCSVALIAPTADNGVVTATTTNPTSYSAQGTYTVTWTYTNANGTATQTQTVIVEDTTNPVAPVLSDVSGTCSVIPTAPTTTDNCAGTITATTNSSFPITVIGTTVVAWIFTDGNGNSISVNQNVVVSDNTAPTTIALATANITCNQTVIAPTAIDNCAGTITGTTTDPVSYAIPGTYSIDWSFNDGNGNVATQIQTVIVSCSSAGLENESTSDLFIYPIPAFDLLNIEVKSPLANELAVICDAQGKKVMETRLESPLTILTISNLNGGVYFLKIGSSISRFVVNK